MGYRPGTLIAITAVALLVACAAERAPEPLATPPLQTPEQTAPADPAPVRRAYVATVAQEKSAITGPDATAGYVSAIHAADSDAQAALAALEHGPSAAAVSRARHAVARLQAALAAKPGGTQ